MGHQQQLAPIKTENHRIASQIVNEKYRHAYTCSGDKIARWNGYRVAGLTN